MYAGTATKNKFDGADWALKYRGRLPDYYITEDIAQQLGYIAKKGNLNEVVPGKMLAKGTYRNEDGHLPSAINRIWYKFVER